MRITRTPHQLRRRSSGAEVAHDARDRGLTTVEILMWAALMVAVVAAITAALQVAGTNIVGWVEDQLTA